ncbi:unnamed protein product, partial [Discosporangium mesarthrocarpum]
KKTKQDELFAIYNVAHVCLVTSVRDGMNLVSHEYVAAQNEPRLPVHPGADGRARSGLANHFLCFQGGDSFLLCNPALHLDAVPDDRCPPRERDDGPGVLVLSEFAGSAQSLSGAIRVNPWNTDEVANAMYQALTLSRVERNLRQHKLYR